MEKVWRKQRHVGVTECSWVTAYPEKLRGLVAQKRGAEFQGQEGSEGDVKYLRQSERFSGNDFSGTMGDRGQIVSIRAVTQ